jgi:hypothetical protein
LGDSGGSAESSSRSERKLRRLKTRFGRVGLGFEPQ